MLLTYKVKHNKDFTNELIAARKVAEFAIANRDKLSSKYVSHLGLGSAISVAILRKYGFNKKAKTVSSVKLATSSKNITFRDKTVWVPSLKVLIPFDKNVEAVNYIEFDREYAYIVARVEEIPQYEPTKSIGVDFNTTGHCAVLAVKQTGKVYKLGKLAEHVHKKYKKIRKNLQKKGLYGVVKRIRNREQRIVKNLNHQISRKIVDLAVGHHASLNLENLKGIRNIKVNKSFKYALNSWSFYQLRQFVEYKALLAGVPVTKVAPEYTSVVCSRCGELGERDDKLFKCPSGHVEHADVNAAFNLAEISPSIVRLRKERDFRKGHTGVPQEATQ